MKKSDREIMEILEAFDLTRCAHSAADLAGCDPKTVSRHVARRDLGHDPDARVCRPMKIDPYRAKIEELVERSAGRVSGTHPNDDRWPPSGSQPGIPTSWRAVLGRPIADPSFAALAAFLEAERERVNVYPPSELVFNALTCRLGPVRAAPTGPQRASLMPRLSR